MSNTESSQRALGPDEVARWLDENFVRLVAERGVPGASVAVLAGGQVVGAAGAGVTSLATGVAVDTDTVFQIGSITKIWTTTLVMQLVDDGLLDLDAPLLDYLPELVIGDMDAAKVLTPRHLLTHTAGFEGDIFTDTGRGDDAVEKYVATLTELPQLFAPGETFSYNNTAFVLLGRIVEVLRGKPYDEVLVERLARPLGLERVSPSPYEAIRHRAATGHVPGEGAEAELATASTWALARSNAPAGSMLAMTPTDLLGFVRMHLDEGIAPDGTRVLSADSVRDMQTRQVDLPLLSGMGDAWGLGWELFDSPQGTVVAHDGGTIGQAAFLRIVPEAGVAIALLTNGGDVFGLFTDVVVRLLADVAGVRLPERPTPPADSQQVDVRRYLGRYADTIYDISVSQDADGALWLDREPKDIHAEIGEQPVRFRLVHLRGDSLISVEPVRGLHVVFTFLGDVPGPDGSSRAKYVHYGRVVSRAD
ncbi:serine hydrolase domain-containing protein [Nocardioides panaciterrulae]|uniref:CubicO group peptidase (Beta-lactamase class C family) n=1 Tax=Nocardioides panaciterrulae TaxID=661492 RepID=A0A7Y9EA09_9ACTN|nr:serine hydrolase domain-containing protein [Nocardioides panaciterrulae]NYD43752.1 CubicO group peptidase (beta-lactamase class C family) [Nocardioides panaciterrulae]